jgi:pyruvate/2-oxoglutarate/acetoin dehydrogenase E1 component
MELLMEHELFTELVVFSQLSPFQLKPLFDCVSHTYALITVEEGTLTAGWGAEVAASHEECSDSSISTASRCGRDYRSQMQKVLKMSSSRLSRIS